MANFKRGFTLIELLVVMAVLAVLAAGVFVAIDPLDKINAANDAKVQNDIGQIAQGMEMYAVVYGTYPSNANPLTVSGDLKVVPVQPSGYSSYTYGAGGASQRACGQLKAKKYTSSTARAWAWCSTSGKAGTVASCGSCP